MHFVEASKCKGIILLKSCCVELLDERVYLQHVVSVTVISSAHIKGNSIFGKMLILWEIHGKKKPKKKRMLDITGNCSIKIQTKVKLWAQQFKLVWKEIFSYPDWSEFNKNRGHILFVQINYWWHRLNMCLDCGHLWIRKEFMTCFKGAANQS